MSKINPLQAAALSSTAVKTDAAKNPVTPKPVVAKIPAAKPAVIKPSPAKAASTFVAAPKKAVKAKVVKIEKEKVPKLKMERDSFTMPKAEYAQFYVLKERLVKLGRPAKKSELLRAGIMQLTAMTDAALKAAMAKVPAIKTGRPKKK